MPSRSTRNVAIAASIAVVIGGGVWGVSRLVSDDDDPAPSSEATSSTGTGVALDVSAGGPYSTDVGGTLVLTASVAVTGQTDTTADLEAIGAALNAYERDLGTYPPAYLSDDDGNALLSWRVLLLPYLGEQDLYDRFDLTKAWDDPANADLVAQIPDVYRAEGAGEAGTSGRSGDTAYAGVTGAKHVFRAGAADLDGGLPRSAVIDGYTMTIGAGPVGSEVSIAWTAPDDVDTTDHSSLGDPAGFDGPGDLVTPLLFLDGTVHTFTDDTAPETVRSWSSIAGDTCSPPASLDLQVNAGWDFDDDGTVDAWGDAVTFPAADAGEHTVALTIDDGLGGVHVVRTTVTVS
jgi:hypothetical protein